MEGVLVSNGGQILLFDQVLRADLAAARRPEQIQRRIISGFRRVRLAASGTVSIVVVLDYIDVFPFG
jgi:hypothetical protein